MAFWNWAAGLCVVLAVGGASARQDAVGKLNAYFDQARAAGKFNGALLIADHGAVILRRADGWENGARTVRLTLADRFGIGSISKEFDAVGLLMLAEEGKISLEDPVAKFIPDLPAWAATVTIDHLLHYTSGLPDVDWATVNSDSDAMRNLRALKALDHPAGTHYAYNNNNVLLRRQVIEKVSGMSFEAFLRQWEFPKAGIRDAVIDPDEGTPRAAKGFDAQFREQSMAAPITGWTTVTVDDFLRWSNCITNFCLIGPGSTRRIVTTGNPMWQSGLGHGTMQGDRLVRHVHDGNNRNYEALLMEDAAKGRTIILATTQNREDVYAMADAVNAILDGKPYRPLSEAAQ